MQYYKIFVNDTFMGIANSLSFRCFQKKHQSLLVCDIKQAQYIQCEENLYHANWMHAPVTDKFAYSEAQIFSINEDEYKLLNTAKEEEIEFFPEPVSVFIEEKWQQPIDPIEALTVDYVKNSRISKMSQACHKAIENGIDITLWDGYTHHFSLTIEDQLNLMSLQTMIANGQTTVPYHADGETYKNFSARDIKAVINAANEHKTYHLAYYNSLKEYKIVIAKIAIIT